MGGRGREVVLYAGEKSRVSRKSLKDSTKSLTPLSPQLTNIQAEVFKYKRALENTYPSVFSRWTPPCLPATTPDKVQEEPVYETLPFVAAMVCGRPRFFPPSMGETFLMNFLSGLSLTY